MSNRTNKKIAPAHLTIGAEQSGRRIDNFLIAQLKPIPKSRIYQMLRRGEVRANGGRIKPDYRLETGDTIRIPPLFKQAPGGPERAPGHLVARLKTRVIHQDERLVVVNKPSGLVVHAGTGRSFGVIELLRAWYRQEQDLHLVHRLDKETSGCLLIAKNMLVLRQINRALQAGTVHKEYDALLYGRLRQRLVRVNNPLQRYRNPCGEGKVRLDAQGKTALSEFERVEVYQNVTRVRVRTGTGRTHQIRVHAAAIGHPLAGDEKYGDKTFNREMCALGLRRMFLHASKISVPALQATGEYRFSAPLPDELDEVLQRIVRQGRRTTGKL